MLRKCSFIVRRSTYTMLKKFVFLIFVVVGCRRKFISNENLQYYMYMYEVTASMEGTCNSYIQIAATNLQ